MGRLGAVPAMVLASVLAGTVGCSDIPGPRPLENAVGLIVSAPVRTPLGAAGVVGPVASSAAASAGVVYVSLPPGSVPAGVRGTITNEATRQSITTAVVGGGFDPVPIAAGVGDTLVTEIAGAASATLSHVRLAVTPVRPLKVVRTSPPAGGRDVPLNAAIVIVFSEPIDSAALSDGSIQLLRDTTPVAGTLRFGDASQLRVEFHPANLLAAQTTFRIVVTKAIRDVNGAALDSPLDVPFTTGITGAATGLVFASVSAGKSYTCGVTTSGTAYCWGTNWAGQLGNGATADGPTPEPVAGGLSLVSLSAGENQACGVTTAGAAYCWGSLGYGGAPLDSATLSACKAFWWCPTPVPVPGGVTFTAVSAGPSQRCGITTTGAAYCWGYGWGPLGFVGDTTFSSTPIAVAGGLTFAAVSAGGSDCGVTITGDAYCWGSGALGNGTTAISPVPVKVAGGLTFKTVSAGGAHACGVTTAGAAYCWGDNNWGELGDGTTTGSSVPVAVAGGFTFATITAHGGGTKAPAG